MARGLRTDEANRSSLQGRFVRAKVPMSDHFPRYHYLSSIIALSNMPACAQPQLIANSQLDQSRIHDTVDRASYAAGLPVNHPLDVALVTRAQLHEIVREQAAANHQSEAWSLRQTAYQTMGFLPEGGQDSHENIGLLSRSAAGLYMPRQ